MVFFGSGACGVSAGSYGFCILWCTFFEDGGRVSPRRARYLFFASPKKSTQKKGDPAVCDPFALLRGKPAAGRLRGAPWNSLCAARAARTTTASQLTRHARFDAHAHPATAPPQAQPDGGGQLNSQTAKQPHGPLLRSAQSAQRAALAPGRCGPSAAMARVAVWLSGFWAAPPSGCACGGAFAGWHGRLRAHASLSDSPRLSERSCAAAK